MYIMQNSVCPPCGGGTLKCSCRKELGDQLQLVRSMLGEIAERSDTCHTITDVTTIGDLRCECACGVQLVPETSAALFIKRTAPRRDRRRHGTPFASAAAVATAYLLLAGPWLATGGACGAPRPEHDKPNHTSHTLLLHSHRMRPPIG